MSNRVLLNDSGLKVSKPGIDVLSAGAGGLQFSSDWSQLGNYLQGTFVVDFNNVANLTAGVTFGVTLPAAPLFNLYYVSGGNNYLLMNLGRNIAFDRFVGVDGSGTQYGRRFYARSTTTRIEWIVNNYGPVPGFLSMTSFTFRYQIVTYGV